MKYSQRIKWIILWQVCFEEKIVKYIYICSHDLKGVDIENSMDSIWISHKESFINSK